MKLLIKFPTRNRPTKFLTVLNQYIQKLDDKETKIIISCDNDDESMKTDIVRDVLSQYKNVPLHHFEALISQTKQTIKDY